MPIVVGGISSPPPYAPSLGPPANLVYTDLTDTPTFYWNYNPAVPTNTQSAWAFSRIISGSLVQQYWNATTSAWQSTFAGNSGAASSVTFPSGSWGAGSTYNWSVSTEDANGWGAFATAFTVTGQSPASVTVLTPSGTVVNASPPVSWSASFPTPGTGQSGYRVIVYDSAQYSAGGFLPGVGPSVYDSGVIGSAYQTTLSLATPPSGPSVLLVNSMSYRAYVQITGTGGQVSSWVYSAFTTSFTGPDAPTLVISTTTDGTTGQPVNKLVVTGHGPSGFVGFTQAIVQRSDGLYLRGASANNPAPLGGTEIVTLYDYECVPSVAYTYTVVLFAPIPDSGRMGTPLPSTPGVTSPSATSDEATLSTAGGWWLVDPLNPSSGVSAQLVTYQPAVTEQSTSHLVMGQSTPNVIANAMGGTDGSGTFETFDAVTYNGLQALLQSQKTIYVMDPYGDANGITYVRFGPQTAGLSTGSGNTVKTATLNPSTASGPHRTIDVTWVAAMPPPDNPLGDLRD